MSADPGRVLGFALERQGDPRVLCRVARQSDVSSRKWKTRALWASIALLGIGCFFVSGVLYSARGIGRSSDRSRCGPWGLDTDGSRIRVSSKPSRRLVARLLGRGRLEEDLVVAVGDGGRSGGRCAAVRMKCRCGVPPPASGKDFRAGFRSIRWPRLRWDGELQEVELGVAAIDSGVVVLVYGLSGLYVVLHAKEMLGHGSPHLASHQVLHESGGE